MLVWDLIVDLGMEMTCIHMSWQSEAGQSYFRRRFRPSPLPSLESTTSGVGNNFVLHLPKHLIALSLFSHLFELHRELLRAEKQNASPDSGTRQETTYRPSL
jgi:hypothetical protein